MLWWWKAFCFRAFRRRSRAPQVWRGGTPECGFPNSASKVCIFIENIPGGSEGIPKKSAGAGKQSILMFCTSSAFAFRRPTIFYKRIATLVPSDCGKNGTAECGFPHSAALLFFYNPIATSRIAGHLLCICSAFALHLRFPRLRNPAICRREQESRIVGHLLCICSALALRRPTVFFFYKRIATLVPL